MSTPANSSSQAAQSSAVAPSPPNPNATSTLQSSEGTATETVQNRNDAPTNLGGVKRKLKSTVWQEFTRVQVGGRWKAECIWCHHKLGGETKNGTKHLHDHLACCAVRQPTKGAKQAHLKFSKNEDGQVSVENYIFDQDIARKELALMMCIHEYPLAMVDHSGFRKFCSALQPMFNIVSRNTIRKDILAMYEAQKNSMMKYFAMCRSRVAITTDMWTSDYQKRGYMAVTAHFIDDCWKLKSFLLRFIYVPAPHTAEVISNILHELFIDWHIERKISTVTLDNCSTNDSLMDKLKEKLSSESLMLDGSLLHMRCCAYILNLIVKDGLGIMDEGIERVRDSVAFWSATPKRHERFEMIARQLNIAYKKRLALDCKTRWNSTYIMISIALEYKDVFERLALRERLFTSCPTMTDWLFASEVCDRLKLFFDITEVLSGTTYVTANLFFPKICGVRLAMQKWQTSNNPIIEKMSIMMIKKFEKYWSEVHGLMAIATVLDPRYKLHLLQALFMSIYGLQHATSEVARIRELLYKLVLQYQELSTEGVGTSCTSSTAAEIHGEDEVFNIFDQYMSSQPIVSSSLVHTELDLYLEEPPLPRTQEIDIINWWKFGGVRYPTLQKIALDILPIPVTTVASESAFSTSGRTISAHRSRLAPKMVEALMCMQAWSRADMIGDGETNLLTCLEDAEETMEDDDSIISVV